MMLAWGASLREQGAGRAVMGRLEAQATGVTGSHRRNQLIFCGGLGLEKERAGLPGGSGCG